MNVSNNMNNALLLSPRAMDEACCASLYITLLLSGGMRITLRVSQIDCTVGENNNKCHDEILI